MFKGDIVKKPFRDHALKVTNLLKDTIILRIRLEPYPGDPLYRHDSILLTTDIDIIRHDGMFADNTIISCPAYAPEVDSPLAPLQSKQYSINLMDVIETRSTGYLCIVPQITLPPNFTFSPPFEHSMVKRISPVYAFFKRENVKYLDCTAAFSDSIRKNEAVVDALTEKQKSVRY